MLLSQLKPVAACSLGPPEPGEMFVITNRDARDATYLDSDTEFALCKAIGKCCLSSFYVVQKAMKIHKAKRS